MLLNQPMFVLQRRINQPLGAIERVLCDPALLRAGSTYEVAEGLCLRLERPFGVTFPPFGLDGASWLAPATVSSRRGRRRVQFELEINAWDTTATELLVRPRSRSPHRWSGRRMERYFRVAHATADGMMHAIGSHAPARVAPSRYAPVVG